MSYQPFAASSSNGNSAAFPWGMPSYFSTQRVENEETHHSDMNVDNVKDQELEFMVPSITFQIPAQLVHPSQYVYAANHFQTMLHSSMLIIGHHLLPMCNLGGSLLKRVLQLPKL